jgi:hypothetical protein
MRCSHFSIRRVAVLLVAAVALLVTPFAHAQSALPPIMADVFPMGGKAGSTIEVKVIGQNLDKAEGLHFSFGGAKVEVLDSGAVKPDPKKPVPNLVLQRFKVTLPADAPLGTHDVRIVTKGGVSNSRAFVIGDLDEVNEQEPNDDVDKAQPITLNGVVNGVISAGTDVDYFAFSGKKGQRVICNVRASSIDSKLHAAVEMYDRKGAYFGLARNYADNDALLDVTLPADGEYLVRVFAFTYSQGGIDHFYRLSVSTAPWIDAVFPPVVQPGKETEVTVYGRNLPGGVLDPASVVDGRALEKVTMKVKAPDDPMARQRLSFLGPVSPMASALDGFSLTVKNDTGRSNPYLLTFARSPVVLDNGANDTQETAQKVAVPCEIAGRIEKRGDVDWYTFAAKKGDVIAIEAQGERLGSPIDLYFQLLSEKGAVVTEQDDTPETMAPHFSARSDDPPRYRFVVPADATYYLKITSRANFTDAGPRHLYTVRIGADEPDFRVIAMPASTQFPDSGVVGQHGGYAFNVLVWRMGGFVGDITLSGEKLPPGLSVRPQIIGPGQKLAVVVVNASPEAAAYTGPINLIGTASVNNQKRVREVRGATIVWPVPAPNILTVSRLDRELVIAVRDKAPYSLTAGTEKIVITQGDKISVPIKLQAHWPDFKSNVILTAAALPPGTNLNPLTLTPGKDGATATLDNKGGAVLPPGTYTIVLRGQTQVPNPKAPPPAMVKGAPINHIQACTPITLVVIPKQLGKLTVTPAQAKAQTGKPLELTVKLARQYDLPLPLKVEAIVDKVKGISAKEVTIAADQEEAKLTLDIDTPPNPQVAITIRATAMFEGTPIVHETKLTVAVGK